MSTGNLQVAFLCVSHHERQRKNILPLRCWNQCSASSGEFSLLAKQVNNHSSNNLACGRVWCILMWWKSCKLETEPDSLWGVRLVAGGCLCHESDVTFWLDWSGSVTKQLSRTDWLIACDSSALTCTVSEPPLPPLSPRKVVRESSCHSANQSLQCVTSCSEEKGSCSTHCVSRRSPTILAVLHMWVKEWTLQTQHFNVCGV